MRTAVATILSTIVRWGACAADPAVESNASPQRHPITGHRDETLETRQGLPPGLAHAEGAIVVVHFRVASKRVGRAGRLVESCGAHCTWPRGRFAGIARAVRARGALAIIFHVDPLLSLTVC